MSRKLYRSRENRMIAGVCGGLGEYFDVDPTVVRLLFVLAAIVTSGGWLLAYIVLAVIVPAPPLDAGAPPAPGQTGSAGTGPEPTAAEPATPEIAAASEAVDKVADEARDELAP